MPATIPSPPRQSEAAILAHVFANGDETMPPEVARYVLALRFSEADQARMHDLAVRNQDAALTPAERDELIAYANAGTALGILKLKARHALKRKPAKRGSA